MAFDTIVFCNEELLAALGNGALSVGLCDNDFLLPDICGVTYTAIGSVSAAFHMTKEEFKQKNISCIGFKPVFCHHRRKQYSR